MSIYLICIYFLLATLAVLSVCGMVILIRNKKKQKRFSYNNLKQKKSSFYIKFNIKSNELTINNYTYINLDISKIIVKISKKDDFEDNVRFLMKNPDEKVEYKEVNEDILYNIILSLRDKNEENVVLRCECDIERIASHVQLYTIEQLKSAHENNKDKRACLYYLNIKDFNSINHRYSEKCGDYILEIIKTRLMRIDKKNLYCCYMNADHFVIYYGKAISKNKALKLIKYINKKITKSIDVGYISVDIVLGIGVCMGEYGSLDEFLKGAYIASDYAKKRKHYNIVIYNEGMKLEENVISVCEEELVHILNSKELDIKYNPVYNQKKSKFVGYISAIDFEDKILDYEKLKNVAIQNDKIDLLMNIVVNNQLMNYLKKRPNKNSKLFITLKLEDLSTFVEVYLSNSSYSDCKIVICLDVRRGYEMINKFSNISGNISKIVEEGIEFAVMINYNNMYDYDYILKNANYLVIDNSVIGNTNSVLMKNKVMNVIELVKNYDLDLLALDIKEYIQFENLSKQGVNYFSGPYFGKSSRKPNEIEQSKTKIFTKFLKDSKKNKNN